LPGFVLDNWWGLLVVTRRVAEFIGDRFGERDT
jgi:hypothetical protein